MAVESWRPIVSVERWEPFRNMVDIQIEMNRLFDSFFDRPAVGAPSATARVWAPVFDMYETKDEVVLDIEVPGVREKDISLSVTGDVLTLRGERAFGQEPKDEDHYYNLERVYGKFERSMQLPMPVQAGKVKATYRDGVLEVRLPKAEEVKPKEIKIDIL